MLVLNRMAGDLVRGASCLFVIPIAVFLDRSFIKHTGLMFGLSVSIAVSEELKPLDNESKEIKGETHIMVIALGSTPARQYSRGGDQGDASMLLPKVGQIPPNMLYYKEAGGERDQLSKWQPFRVSFNNMSVMHSIPAKLDFVLYRKLASRYEPYVVIPAGDIGMRRVVLLTQSPVQKNQSMGWKAKPQVAIINRDSASLHDKQFAIKNLSQTKVLHAFDREVATISPGILMGYSRNRNGFLYHLAARYGAERKIIYNLAINFQQDGALHLYILYDAAPVTNAGRSVAVFRMVL